MKRSIKTVGLIGKYHHPPVAGHIQRLSEFLQRRGLQVALESNTAQLIKGGRAPTYPLAELAQHIDLALIIGGDGTMLHVARSLAARTVPIVGVNQGRLGFLTDVAVDRMEEEIGRILDGDYQAEHRLLLYAEIMRKGRIVHAAHAFNDVIINKGELARLIEFETYIGGEFVQSVRGDGVIVASPTGSTAYALSAGGPILHPTLPAIGVVPICPHTLSTRPIVVSSDTTIEIVMIGLAGSHAHVTFDGQLNYVLEDGDRIYVRRAENSVELWHPSGRNHFDVLRAKLHWGTKY